MKILYKIRNILFGSKLKRALSLTKKSPLKERWHDFLDHWHEVYTDLIIVPWETTCRFFYWGWKLRYNYSWDCSHVTYYILHLKFKKMIEYSRKYGHLVWNSKEDGTEFRRLKLACELAKRLYDDDYNVNMKKHDAKWGKGIFDWQPYRNGCSELKIYHANVDRKKLEENLCKLIEKRKGLNKLFKRQKIKMLTREINEILNELADTPPIPGNYTEEQLKEMERKEFRAAHEADDLQRKNEKKQFFELLEKYLEGWWD